VSDRLEERFDRQGREWRDPAQVVAQWSEAGEIDDRTLELKATGGWWAVLEATGATLIVSREYEHLLLAITATTRPRVSYLRLPHPSGIAFDRARGKLYVASTRNPNQLFEFAPVAGTMPRADATPKTLRPVLPLVPTRTWYLPGCSYIHDLAMIGTRLHANAVGQNVVVALDDGTAQPVWWPASIERHGTPRTDRNYIQLNSIAAGDDLSSSFFSASGERPGRLRPGHLQYPVDGLGVIYSGATREPVVRGLTRPHSARLHGGRLWVDNSGYGELGFAVGDRLQPIAKLPGWTRGLALVGDVAFVGTSRVIPRFRQYAPGLEVERSVCGVHAIDTRTGKLLGSLTFPSGNQIFAIEPVPAAWSGGFPFYRGSRSAAARSLFYAYCVT
jgi:uncharacterized protein (TIGR03032 family)